MGRTIITILYLIAFFASIGISTLQGQLIPISQEDGLSQGMIYHLMQDGSGFVWIATKDGLNRYDGHDIRVYTPQSEDNFSISDHHLYYILEDSRGYIWLASSKNGVILYCPCTERFFTIKRNTNQPTTLQTNSIRTLKEDKTGSILVGNTAGFDRIVLPPNFSLENISESDLHHRVRIQNLWSGGEVVSSIFSDEEKTYWGSETGLFRLTSFDDGEIEDLTQTVNKQFPEQAPESITGIVEGKNGSLWLIRPHHLSWLKGDTVKHHELGLERSDPSIGFYPVDSNQLLITSSEIRMFDLLDDGEIEEKIDVDLEGNFGYSAMVDHSGIYWIGTDGYGIIKFNPIGLGFTHHMPGESLRSIFEDASGRIFVRNAQSLQLLDPIDGQTSFPTDWPEDLRRSFSVMQDREGIYWFHFPFEEEKTALISWDETTGEKKKYIYGRPPFPLSLIWEDNDGHLFLSSRDGHLMVLTTERDTFINIDLRTVEGTDAEGFSTNHLIHREDGKYLAATSGGLISFYLNDDFQIEQAELFSYQPSNPNSPGSNYIYHIHEDEQEPDLLWIASRGGGLNKMNLQTRAFERFTADNGLPNNVVYGVLPAGENLWLSTNRGLSVFNKSKETFRSFTTSEGLQHIEFNHSSFLKSEDGRLFFGGINGLNVFNPEEVLPNPTVPNTVITGIRVNADPLISAHCDQGQGPAVEFDHNKNNWSFSYSAMDFTDPGMNTFIYRLKGVNRNWVEAGNRREASYMNLSPGTYEFQVKGSNSSGLWSPEPATFSFVIKAPWWQSSLAYVFYFLLGLTAIYLVIQFRVRRANIKNQLTWEKREGERLKELDQVKARFFSTMTHEFKTPLSMIIEPIRQAAEEVKDPGLKHHLNLAEQNSLHLLNLLQQIQQLSKLKSGRDQKESRAVNFKKLILKFSDNYHSVYERKGIQLKLELPEEDTHFLIDSPAVQQTLYYLFGNAIKNCPVNGEIIISQKISKLTIGDKRKINFRISYTKNQEGGGTTSKNECLETVKEEKRNLTIPIGTIMIKEVIELIGGKIEVDRTIDQGAEIEVSFLLDEISGKAEAGSDTAKIESQVGWIAGSANTMENQSENSLDDRELILLVEDNADLRLFIKSIVEPKYELIEAADGQEGLDKSIEVVPDLVITDWAMPKKDGLQMTRELKEHEITCHIPILILTAKTTKDERIEGLRAKADGFLTKPFHSEELLTTIETLISNRKTIIEKFLGREKGEGVFPKDEMSEGNIYLLPDANFLNKIDEIILENITDEELGADTLAQKMYISRMQLYRKLKAISGQSAAVYIRNFRLKKARELLQGSRKNVNEVALMVGFSSRNYFSRRFKEKYGIAPSKAKKLL